MNQILSNKNEAIHFKKFLKGGIVLDDTILSTGLALVGLGIAFLLVLFFDALSGAYISGGIILGFGLRVKREITKSVGVIIND